MNKDIDIAFVLSSGGNRGPIGAGALGALLKHSITPQLLVGTSIGALNAIHLATNPTINGAENLVEIWTAMAKEKILGRNYLSMGRRLITSKDSLFSNTNLKRLIESNLPPKVRYFGDISDVQLRIVATNLNTGKLHVFGRDPSESLVDAAMASTAVPPYLPPWEYRGCQYVDGAVVSALPIGVALAEHARKVYAIDVNFTGEVKSKIKGVFNIAGRAVSIMMYQQFLNDLKWAQLQHTTIYHISSNAFQKTRMWDMKHTEEMLKIGKEMVSEFLNQEHPAGYTKYEAPLEPNNTN